LQFWRARWCSRWCQRPRWPATTKLGGTSIIAAITVSTPALATSAKAVSTTSRRRKRALPAQAGAAGTIESFNGSVLVIMLNAGSTVSGKVTQRTELECEAAEPAGMQQDDRGPGGGGGPSGEDQGDRGDDGSQDEPMCAPGALAPGASVHEAELRITGSGAFWEEVELTPRVLTVRLGRSERRPIATGRRSPSAMTDRA
jgi:hypothetical protein